jgi:arsenate reductase (thioredoxin)
MNIISLRRGGVASVVLALAAIGMSGQCNAEKPQYIEPFREAIERVVGEAESIDPERQERLMPMARYLREHRDDPTPPSVVFVCTHNSRRSQLAQFWATVAAAEVGLERIGCYSCGTEATACNPRTVAALRRAGVSVVAANQEKNPLYLAQFDDLAPAVKLTSKAFGDSSLPKDSFVAAMCCGDADERCPTIAGATFRVPLHYEDPKVTDGTPEEAGRYDERSGQIAAEMMFVMIHAAQ